jgi:hypothetical protein
MSYADVYSRENEDTIEEEDGHVEATMLVKHFAPIVRGTRGVGVGLEKCQ